MDIIAAVAWYDAADEAFLAGREVFYLGEHGRHQLGLIG